jgi:hypothetical protein
MSDNNMNALIVSGSALLSSLIGLVGYLIKINNNQSERLKRIECSIDNLKNEINITNSPIHRKLTIEPSTPRPFVPLNDTPYNTTVDFNTFEQKNNIINI